MEAIEMLPMYYANRKAGRGEPDGYIVREGARELVESGLAEWVNKKCKSIKLKKTAAEVYRPDQSLVLGPTFMEAYASGLAWARGIFGEFAAN